MNKIYKVIYSKVRNCYVVVSELAKNHSRGTKAEHTARKGTALTAALLLALSCVSVLGAPGAEAKTKTRTDGSNFIGVERTDGTFEDSSYRNYNGGGAEGPQSITIGTAAEAGNSTITIGDRRAGASIGSVYVGQGDIKNPFTDRGGWVTSVGYNSDATGYGSIAIGSNAIAQNDIKQNIELSNASGDLNDNPTIKGASVALGYSASAADGSIAIGSYSEATAAASTATAKFRDTTDSDYNAPSSYVSVGSSTLKRRITNVAAGADENDAATVGQLEKAKGKYYSAHDGIQLGTYKTNEDNDGASALAGLAAGYETGTTGIASTVVGSYSGVIGSGLQGAAAVSVGTVNVNSNTDTSKTYSGVANSIVGQANMTTNSNAAIILGAGNTITDSYRDVTIDTSKMKTDTPEELEEALQEAVAGSGAQVMAIGGGNKITSAYKTQVVGLGNKVSGTELNYVEGFNNTVTGGTSNYIIGAKNNLTGGSKNIVFGDNHTLSNKSNNVVIGSADSSKELAASGAVVIGHNADVSVDNGVALGSDSVASVQEGQKGYDPAKEVENKTMEPWTSTKAAVSVGKADGSVTRQITGVAAGTNDTDAVNVAQIKKLASIDASNIGKNFKNGDVTANENAWGEALGTGTVTKDNKQLVTGGTVYNEVRPSKDGKYVKMSQTTGANLIALDDQVKTNTDKLSDVNSRSVKYDTKTENGKTVVDNTKITLAGEGGTTITNLKDGVNANDAATVGQMDAKISGVTYKAGDGIKYDTDAENNKTISVNKGDGLKFTEDHKLAVNTGKHLSVNTNGQIEVGDNGAVAENDGNLVTGDTVYKALNGGMTKMIIGTPGKDGKDGKDGTPGTIGLVGPAGTNGKDGVVDITIQKGEDGKDGTKGANGVDGKDGINRIVYEDKNGKHQVATMEDGLKFKGDDGKEIAKKLNNTMEIVGGAKGTLTDGNIGVNSTTDGKLKIQLAQNLTGITSISGSTDGNGAKITLDTADKNISVNGGSITHMASGLSNSDGSYAEKDAGNAANISDVNKMINKAVTDAKGETQQDLDKKANVDASNIGTNLKGADGKTAATEAEQKANLDKWGEAIGTGKVENGSKQLVTGETVYNAVKDKADRSYVDDQLKTKANTDGSNIDKDAFSKNVAVGEVNATDERAVSGKTVQKAIDDINSDMTRNLNGKANVALDNITDAGKNVIKDQARGAVTIDNKGLNTNVVATKDETNHTTTYTINVEGNGKVASGDTGLISGNTLYNEVRPASDGSYIKTTNTTAQNLSSLDTQVKKNSDLVNSDGSTIKIGSKDTATKVDISDKNGSGRVITGVVTDTNDASSAANVGYVNNMAAANTQQIYRDMNNAYGRLDNNINWAAAGSNALAALHPLEFDPDDKLSFAMGYGHYHNANAAAVGAFYQPNSKTQFNFGVALGNGDPGFNAGIAFKLGKSSPYAGMNRVTLIHAVQDLKASEEAKDKRIDALEKENQDMKKQLQAIMAKLNG
ncbi:ESPR-type extended signal peptide-containing protein [Acidaminococcus timonensis]|uniref:ESPR-type extended signal peptide-containing protein n=1 Tax=Acidaminococcus timonensis TaxID=1871002 RepID=UPI0026EA28A5|nr:ESPR-type extended signal peptide-containing protein [Acidaminococcus timonensis]